MITVWSLILILAVPASSDRVLDLTRVPRSTRRFIPTVRSSRITHSALIDAVQPVGPITLRLLSLDSTGPGQVTYAVRLTNSSGQSICIPKDLVLSDVEPLTPKPYSYSGGSLVLIAKDSRRETRALEQVTVVDDPKHAHCEKLAAGDSLVIRATTKLASPTDSRPMLRKRIELQAMWSTFSARVWFSQGQIHEEMSSNSSVLSENALPGCALDCD